MRSPSGDAVSAVDVKLDGRPVVEQVFRGPSLDAAVNIKSASKTIIDALEKPELMERVAEQTWETGIGPELRIITRVDAARDAPRARVESPHAQERPRYG